MDVAFDPSDLDHAIYTSSDENSITRDGGTSWTPIAAPGRLIHFVDFAPFDGRVVWSWRGFT
jgi:hypothetical protein